MKNAPHLAVVTLADLLGPLAEPERKNAPDLLYAAGDTDLLRRGVRVAVIGTRRPSAPGLRRARKLAAELVGAGVTVVSGLAAGIDTAAHQAAMAAGGRTVAVLATPLDQTWPPANRALQHRIAAEHLALTACPPGAAVTRASFPARNRLMALLSAATVIVEAGDASGALAQGWEALRLGRPLFVLKSLLDLPDLVWPRRMLHYGAQLAATTASITSQLSPPAPAAGSPDADAP
jgi:DNA processing protein